MRFFSNPIMPIRLTQLPILRGGVIYGVYEDKLALASF